MQKLRAIKDHIIFQFEDMLIQRSNHGTERRQFGEKTDWGFEISSYAEGAKLPRWCVVTSVGPAVKENVSVGDRVLVDSLKWTEGVPFAGETYWRTDEEHILLVEAANID